MAITLDRARSEMAVITAATAIAVSRELMAAVDAR